MERQTAHKAWIGTLLKGKVNLENERLISLDIGTKKISRVNLIANVVDRYSGDSRPYVALTLDDSSGNIRVKAFADSITLLSDINIGDTILIVGMLRSFNDEIYITPEIVKIVEPKWALIRRLELTKEYGLFKNEFEPKYVNPQEKAEAADVEAAEIIEKEKIDLSESPKSSILKKIKENAEGMDIEKLILELKISMDEINKAIKELIAEGEIYEPRPGYLRSLD